MLFSNKLLGFIKCRSTTLQLLQILDTCTEWLEQGGQVAVVHTDLEQAFDKILHKRLISKCKLHSYGLPSLKKSQLNAYPLLSVSQESV